MFFSIGQSPDHRFANRQEHHGLWINFDDGWHVGPTQIHKGYISNSCTLDLSDSGVTVNHSHVRSFPLWFEHGFITNLFPNRGKSAWASDHLHMDLDGRIVWTPIELDLVVPEPALTVEQAQAHIVDRLDAAVKEIQQPVTLFCSGGLDTFLIYSLLRYHDQPMNLIRHEHNDTSWFSESNRDALDHCWGYRQGQLHHWNQPTWLASGGCGDEYFLRGPAVIAQLTAWHDIDFAQLIRPGHYHYSHFQKYQDLWQQTWTQRQQLRQHYPDLARLYAHLLNTLANDHQHWHLGHTITWTPLKNIEIARTLLQVPVDQLMSQFAHGDITRRIINHYCPEVLNFVSRHKNHQADQYVDDFWQWHHA